jgi:hypothetical protein
LNKIKLGILTVLACANGYLLNGCYQLDMHYPDAEYPVAFGQHLAGYEITGKSGFISETLWVYHAGDLGQLPMGSREGIHHDAIWQHTFHKNLLPGQGIHYLKVRQRQTFATVLTRLLTLGVLSPTEVHIEGEVVSVTPIDTPNSN